MTPASRWFAIVVVITLVAAGTSCSNGTSSRATPPTSLATGSPKTSAAETPGALLDAQRVAAPGVNGTAYRVEYWSKAWPTNRPVKVSGLVVVPKGTAPPGGWPIVTWAHPTGGLTGNCAPSLTPATAVPFANELLAKGWEVTATDYLNENAYAPSSKALLAYDVGVEEARNVIDIVRAARGIRGANASLRYAVWGWSEGGTATVFADGIADHYAPELTLSGAVATSVGSVSPAIFGAALTTGAWPDFFMDIAAYHDAYGDRVAPLEQVLTPLGIRLIATALRSEPKCILSVLATLGHYTSAQVTKVTRLPPAWAVLAKQNDPGELTAAGSAPLLVIQGSQDQTVFPVLSSLMAKSLCALRPAQPLQRWVYSGLNHDTAVGEAVGPRDISGNGDAEFGKSNTANDMLHWLSDRFAHDAWPDPYRPTGTSLSGPTVPVTQTHTC